MRVVSSACRAGATARALRMLSSAAPTRLARSVAGLARPPHHRLGTHRRLREGSASVARRRTRAALADGGGTPTDPWNKAPIDLSDRLYGYLLEHTREPEVLRRLRVETSQMRGSQMQVPPEQGAFMALLCELIGARRVVEIGTYTGYSSVAMALTLPKDDPEAYLVACDSSEPSLEVARRYWKEAGVDGVVREMLGDGAASLETLIAESEGARPFDVAFVDADKRGYWGYYEQLLKLVRPGGLIAVDNVLWYGRVADASETGKQTEAIRAFNRSVFEDERVTHCTVPVGDGLTLVRVRA